MANNTDVSVTLGNENILAGSSLKRLGVKIDNNLNFSEHVMQGNQKLHALARIATFLN